MRKVILLNLFLIVFLSCNEHTKTQLNEKKSPQKTFTDIEINNYVEDSVAYSFFDLSTQLEEKNKIDSAIYFVKQAIKIEKHPMFYNQLGSLQSYSGQYEIAIKSLNTGKAIDTLYWPLYINEARVYLLIKEFKKADLILLKVINESSTKYWKSFSYIYLCASYINNHKECHIIKKCFQKASYLKNNSEFSHTLNILKEKIEKSCN